MSEDSRASFGPRDPGWLPYRLGRSALADAKDLETSEETQASALLLYRSAIVLLLHTRAIETSLEAAAAGAQAGTVRDLPVFATLASELGDRRPLIELRARRRRGHACGFGA